MNKILAWFFEKTKAGKIVKKIQDIISGYKTYIAAFALIAPALAHALQSFSDQGASYLIGFGTTPEYAQIALGLGMIFGRSAISKIGQPNANVTDKIQNAADAPQK